MNPFGVESHEVSKGMAEKLVRAKMLMVKGRHAKPKAKKPNLALRPLSTLKALTNAKG